MTYNNDESKNSVADEIYLHDSNNLQSKDFWEEILKCKNLFHNSNIDPQENRFIRQEVAESWIRSKQLGVNPHSRFIDHRLKEADFERALKNNAGLIQVAAPLIDSFSNLAMSSGFSLELFDTNGVVLLGIHLSNMKDKINSSVWNESTTGTNAHSLAMRYKKPFQLIGPENYLYDLPYLLCSAAPILDKSGVVLGALSLAVFLSETPWDKNLNNVQALSLGWVRSLVVSIENNLQLRNSNNSLNTVNEDFRRSNQMLSMTLEMIDEGIVTIDSDGTITRTNREGSKILHLDNVSSKKNNISHYLANWPSFLEVLQKDKNADYLEKLVMVGQQEKPYLVSVRSVLKKGSKDLDMALLRFNHPEKINALVTSRGGSSAKFCFDDLIGENELIQKAKNYADRFAVSQENVLILGESGTGKELFAQAIHNKYKSNGPFIAVNCAAMPRNLIESELFGYVRGAFTGAEKNGRPGKIELADGGTLFLDEIGDMPYELQAVLLRVLQDKQVMRIGGNHYQKVNFRLIAATNQNLGQLVQEKKFRDDLYFRLSVLKIEIPPLRDRGYDIALLAEYFIKQYAERMGYPVSTISPEARKAILNYDWPGNVRQLENAIIYAVNLAGNRMIEIQHLPKELVNKKEKTPQLTDDIENQMLSKSNDSLTMKDWEKAVIEKALIRTDYHVVKASELLNISKATLYRKIREYRIHHKKYHLDFE